MKKFFYGLFTMVAAILIAGCSLGAEYKVTYDGNGSSGGEVPVDSSFYSQNAAVTVQENSGSLVRPPYSFGGWNTAASANGTSYAVAAFFLMGNSDVTLYAKWLGTHTLAGDGTTAFSDGIGTAAQFYWAYGVAVDSNGNVYVADTFNHSIRKITPAGLVTTLAGDGTPGFLDGTGTIAQFTFPSGVAVDSSGYIYVADEGNERIRKISPAGVVTTLAGDGLPGFLDGTGVTAQFNSPRGVAVDSSGYIYVADTTNQRIRKITPAGLVTTLAGDGTAAFLDGTGTIAQFSTPNGVAVDSSGNIYVADEGNERIRKITSAGVVTTLAGDGTLGYIDGIGTNARFNSPRGVSIDSGENVYVADTGNNRIRKITPAGVATTVAGEGTAGYQDGSGTNARFFNPFGVAVDSSGNVYVADTYNNRIRKIIQ